jgi:hypothetical protein
LYIMKAMRRCIFGSSHSSSRHINATYNFMDVVSVSPNKSNLWVVGKECLHPEDSLVKACSSNERYIRKWKFCDNRIRIQRIISSSYCQWKWWRTVRLGGEHGPLKLWNLKWELSWLGFKVQNNFLNYLRRCSSSLVVKIYYSKAAACRILGHAKAVVRPWLWPGPPPGAGPCTSLLEIACKLGTQDSSTVGHADLQNTAYQLQSDIEFQQVA